MIVNFFSLLIKGFSGYAYVGQHGNEINKSLVGSLHSICSFPRIIVNEIRSSDKIIWEYLDF